MRALLLALCLTGCAAGQSPPDQPADPAITTYLGNEGLMVTDGQAKILFDPLFPMGFGVYQMLPEEMRSDLMQGLPPYDGVDAIFVSHMHPDHFDVDAVIAYLETHTETRLFAPAQAVDWMREEAAPDSPIFARVTPVPLTYGDAALTYSVGEIKIGAGRIPHSGWPDRAEVSNLVFRVTLPGGETVMHMGDADVNDIHFAPHEAHWQAQRTDTAYPPYWFQLMPQGEAIIDTRLNTEQAVGIHVPVILPNELNGTGIPHFHTPGETRPVRHSHDHSE